MSKHFLFLDIRDREICTLLHELRTLFNEKPSDTGIHITVRGPYVDPLKADDIKPFQEILKNDTVIISGVGRFENQSNHVVYLHIECEHLIGIWSKRDYPISTYGFNPHISLYEGNDKQLANRIEGFLLSENIVLKTKEFVLTPYVSKQLSLFTKERRRFEKHFLRLILAGTVKADILVRAKSLVDEYKGKQSNA